MFKSARHCGYKSTASVKSVHDFLRLLSLVDYGVFRFEAFTDSVIVLFVMVVGRHFSESDVFIILVTLRAPFATVRKNQSAGACLFLLRGIFQKTSVLLHLLPTSVISQRRSICIFGSRERLLVLISIISVGRVVR